MIDISVLNPTELDVALDSLIVISLFSDKSTESPYWAEPQLGSKLFTLARAKKTNQNLRLAEQYATDALKWLVDDGWLESLIVSSEYRGESLIILIEPSGREVNLNSETITSRTSIASL